MHWNNLEETSNTPKRTQIEPRHNGSQPAFYGTRGGTTCSLAHRVHSRNNFTLHSCHHCALQTPLLLLAADAAITTPPILLLPAVPPLRQESRQTAAAAAATQAQKQGPQQLKDTGIQVSQVQDSS